MPRSVASTGQLVRTVRQARGLTFSELASRSGVSRSYLYQIETGASSPTVEKLMMLAGALDVPPASLLPTAVNGHYRTFDLDWQR